MSPNSCDRIAHSVHNRETTWKCCFAWLSQNTRSCWTSVSRQNSSCFGFNHLANAWNVLTLWSVRIKLQQTCQCSHRTPPGGGEVKGKERGECEWSPCGVARRRARWSYLPADDGRHCSLWLLRLKSPLDSIASAPAALIQLPGNLVHLDQHMVAAWRSSCEAAAQPKPSFPSHLRPLAPRPSLCCWKRTKTRATAMAHWRNETGNKNNFSPPQSGAPRKNVSGGNFATWRRRAALRRGANHFCR